jgi:hypothetical protein
MQARRRPSTAFWPEPRTGEVLMSDQDPASSRVICSRRRRSRKGCASILAMRRIATSSSAESLCAGGGPITASRPIATLSVASLLLFRLRIPDRRRPPDRERVPRRQHQAAERLAATLCRGERGAALCLHRRAAGAPLQSVGRAVGLLPGREVVTAALSFPQPVTSSSCGVVRTRSEVAGTDWFGRTFQRLERTRCCDQFGWECSAEDLGDRGEIR